MAHMLLEFSIICVKSNSLRKNSGLRRDAACMNAASCQGKITFMDKERRRDATQQNIEFDAFNQAAFNIEKISTEECPWIP